MRVKCDNCGTVFVMEDDLVYDGLRREWTPDCPACGNPTFSQEGSANFPVSGLDEDTDPTDDPHGFGFANLLSVKQVAHALRVSTARVNALVTSGVLLVPDHARIDGRTYLISRASVEAYMSRPRSRGRKPKHLAK